MNQLDIALLVLLVAWAAAALLIAQRSHVTIKGLRQKIATAKADGELEFRQSLWHPWVCPGTHDYGREPDRRKGEWLEFHCVRCGHQFWRQKKQQNAGLGVKSGGA